MFSFALREKNTSNLSEKPTAKDDNIFEYMWKIYDVVNGKTLNYRKDLDDILKNIDPSKYGFVVWVLNHNLVYNKFTREHLELFTLVSSTLLPSEEYIRFYVDYMVKSGVRFPKFLPWYKIGVEQEDKKYKELIKEEFSLDDVGLEDALEYLRNQGISIRELCLNLL